MMTHFSQFDLNSPPPGIQHPKDASKAPARLQSTSTLQKLMPLVHAVSVWTLLAYFVLWMEPQVFESLVPVVGLGDRWSRWAALTRKAATSDLGWLGVQVVV
jgi:GET complex subunit GET2